MCKHKLHDSRFYGTTGCFTIKLFKSSPCAHHNSPHVNYAQWHFNGLFKVNEWDLLVKIFVCEQAYSQESPKSSASQCSSKESPGIQSDSFFEACRLGWALWNRNSFEFKFDDTRLSSHYKNILWGKSGSIFKFEFKTTLVS